MANSIDNWIQYLRQNQRHGRVRIFDRSDRKDKRRMIKKNYYHERRDKLLKECPWVGEFRMYRAGKKACFYVKESVLDFVEQERENRKQIYKFLKADFLVEGYKFLAEMED